jgi:hypothetical protein|uniref:Uncharacterized protein n=1 Tax=Candidatus Aramenus sulfurataquae TaxID=1326980 RepID=A0A0F2LMG9_9CREN|nr:hypothetical protein [Candidatus Aramenus sulfurataquae]
MVSLKQVTSVTVTSPWSSYNSSSGQTGRGSVVNPSYPIFIFDYQSTAISVGYVVGSNAGTYQNQADANYLTVPGLYFSVFGYNYWIGGGGECSVSGCMNNGINACGPWWAIVDLSSNTLNTYCIGITPNNPVSSHLQNILADLVNQNILFIQNTTSSSYLLIWIIPVSQISSMLSNTAPSNMKWAYIQSSEGTNQTVYTQTGTIYSGNLVYPAWVSTTLYIWVTPLSSIYNNATSGTPSSSSSPVTVGTLYQIASLSNTTTALATVIGVPSSSGVTVYVSVEAPTGSSGIAVYNISPSNWSVSNSSTFSLPATILTFVKATWNGVFLYPGWSGSNVYVMVVDPKTMSMEYTPTPGAYIMIGAEGYAVVASQALNSSSVTWTVYQILLDHTYVFQNVSITISGSTITATGTLYDLTTNSAVGSVTVWLVAVGSLSDQYSDDVVFITSGTTNSNGQFSISGSIQTGYTYYGVLYTP